MFTGTFKIHGHFFGVHGHFFGFTGKFFFDGSRAKKNIHGQIFENVHGHFFNVHGEKKTLPIIWSTILTFLPDNLKNTRDCRSKNLKKAKNCPVL